MTEPAQTTAGGTEREVPEHRVLSVICKAVACDPHCSIHKRCEHILAALQSSYRIVLASPPIPAGQADQAASVGPTPSEIEKVIQQKMKVQQSWEGNYYDFSEAAKAIHAMFAPSPVERQGADQGGVVGWWRARLDALWGASTRIGADDRRAIKAALGIIDALTRERDQLKADVSWWEHQFGLVTVEKEAAEAALTEAQRRLRETREALEQIVEEKCDYMRINNLGDPETQHTVRLARPALRTTEPKP